MTNKAILTMTVAALACGTWATGASAAKAKHHHRAQVAQTQVKCPVLPAPGGCVDPSEIMSKKNHHTTPMPGNNPMASAGAGH